MSDDKKRVYMDLKIGEQEPKRITIELNYGIAPKTCENFRELCRKQVIGEGYKGSKFHRILPNFMMQGGDFTKGNGTGGRSIYGEKFRDENFTLKHSKKHILSMANCGPNTNGSQFFITFVPCEWLDGKHVVFGEVVGGNEVVDMVNQYAGDNQKKNLPVVIVDCGDL